MALISTIKVTAALWRAESVHEITAMNSLPPGFGINRLNTLLCNTDALNYLTPSPELKIDQWERSGGESADGADAWDRALHQQNGCPGRHMWPEVPPGSSEVFVMHYKEELGQGQMIATADKWESSTESVPSAWLLATAVARETDVSLMETRISENFHLPRFHWSRQPFLWKQ